MTMKQAVALLLAIVAWGLGPAWAEEGVPYARDLHKDARSAQNKEGLVLVVFSGAFCSYCDTVLNEFLIPMSRNADYQSKLVMRKVEASSDLDMRDFNGKIVSHRQFAGDSGARMVPTVMLFDSRGKRVAKPLVGLSTVDYYGFYLDQAINQGLEKVRSASLGGILTH
jgi:thioredoxin-related protein